jgi:hypothetical protein
MTIFIDRYPSVVLFKALDAEMSKKPTEDEKLLPPRCTVVRSVANIGEFIAYQTRSLINALIRLVIHASVPNWPSIEEKVVQSRFKHCDSVSPRKLT